MKLDVGDYGCQFADGYIPPVYFERKGLSDLFGTLGKGYKRFKKEILRAKENKFTMIIIIEGTLSKVLSGYERSTIGGISIIRQLFTLWIKYGIHPVFCKDKFEMSNYIAEFYCAIGRKYLEKDKWQNSVLMEGRDSCLSNSNLVSG